MQQQKCKKDVALKQANIFRQLRISCSEQAWPIIYSCHNIYVQYMENKTKHLPGCKQVYFCYTTGHLITEEIFVCRCCLLRKFMDLWTNNVGNAEKLFDMFSLPNKNTVPPQDPCLEPFNSTQTIILFQVQNLLLE